MTIFKSLFSFESIFVLWLFSYQYKNIPALSSFPHVTIFLTLILIPWGLVLYFKNKPAEKTSIRDTLLLVFLGMSLWFITTSFWSPSHDYKLQKTLCYLIYTIPGFLAGYMVISQDKMRLRRLLGAFVVFSMIILGECFRVFWMNGLTTMSDIMNTNYLVTGQTLGVGLLILMAYSYFDYSTRVPNVSVFRGLWFWSLLLGSLFFYALINLGGRGPVIATVLALTVFYALRGWQDSPSKTALHLGILSVFCIGTTIIFNGIFEHTTSHFMQRAAPLLTGQIDEAVTERFTFYQSAYHTFLQHPIAGVGLGGWPISHGLGEINLHPHNIFLEILSETGLIGLFLFLGFLSLILKSHPLKSIFSSPDATCVTLLTLFSFLNALKTGDLHDNLLFFIGLSLYAGLTHWKKTISSPFNPQNE
ncbi:MAG: O-antigen ligase family protein [Alphaproteobacteria bacterium]|nr:O-antigen ligase family protein [Alphaproteobacteria bacterium]